MHTYTHTHMHARTHTNTPAGFYLEQGAEAERNTKSRV